MKHPSEVTKEEFLARATYLADNEDWDYGQALWYAAEDFGLIPDILDDDTNGTEYAQAFVEDLKRYDADPYWSSNPAVHRRFVAFLFCEAVGQYKPEEEND